MVYTIVTRRGSPPHFVSSLLLFPVSDVSFSDSTSRIAGNDCPRRHILSDNRASTDDRALADGHAGHNESTGGNPILTSEQNRDSDEFVTGGANIVRGGKDTHLLRQPFQTAQSQGRDCKLSRQTLTACNLPSQGSTVPKYEPMRRPCNVFRSSRRSSAKEKDAIH